MQNQSRYNTAKILLVEDNPADQEITKRALKDSKIDNGLYITEDGVEAMEYLERKGKYADPNNSPTPDLVLLDINMPRMDGKEVLQQIRKNQDLKHIPVVMLTTSDQEKDIFESYQLGVNAYITKPVDFKKFSDVMRQLKNFWFNIAVLPERRD